MEILCFRLLSCYLFVSCLMFYFLIKYKEEGIRKLSYIKILVINILLKFLYYFFLRLFVFLNRNV